MCLIVPRRSGAPRSRCAGSGSSAHSAELDVAPARFAFERAIRPGSARPTPPNAVSLQALSLSLVIVPLSFVILLRVVFPLVRRALGTLLNLRA